MEVVCVKGDDYDLQYTRTYNCYRLAMKMISRSDLIPMLYSQLCYFKATIIV